MYTITIHRTFAAAHAIRLYDGSLEPLHGHNWSVDVTVAAEELDEIEVVMDFHALERALDHLLALVNNSNLNGVAPFADRDKPGSLKINPTAERVAWWIGTELAPQIPAHARLESVTIGEAPGCTATYRPRN
jgi:6-pyruvoyltetrahydropterin/6-carboxytetrahydropterin synthase